MIIRKIIVALMLVTCISGLIYSIEIEASTSDETRLETIQVNSINLYLESVFDKILDVYVFLGAQIQKLISVGARCL